MDDATTRTDLPIETRSKAPLSKSLRIVISQTDSRRAATRRVTVMGCSEFDGSCCSLILDCDRFQFQLTWNSYLTVRDCLFPVVSGRNTNFQVSNLLGNHALIPSWIKSVQFLDVSIDRR